MATTTNKLNIKEFLDKDEQKDLLRFLTAGSVDDGKSTLIGRLLFDSKKIYEDQLDALERDSKRMGNAGDHIDYALLLDGLKAEREQGITIDVAYRYFRPYFPGFPVGYQACGAGGEQDGPGRFRQGGVRQDCRRLYGLRETVGNRRYYLHSFIGVGW